MCKTTSSRSEKINQMFIELSTAIPGLKKVKSHESRHLLDLSPEVWSELHLPSLCGRHRLHQTSPNSAYLSPCLDVLPTPSTCLLERQRLCSHVSFFYRIIALVCLGVWLRTEIIFLLRLSNFFR